MILIMTLASKFDTIVRRLLDGLINDHPSRRSRWRLEDKLQKSEVK